MAPITSSEHRNDMGQLSRRSPTVGQLAQHPGRAAQQEPSRAAAGPGAGAGPAPPPAQLPWAGSGGSTLPARGGGGGGGDAGGRPPVRPSVSARRTPAAPPPLPSQPENATPTGRKPSSPPPAHETPRRARALRQKAPQRAPIRGQGGHMAAEHEAEALLQGVRWAGSDSENDSEDIPELAQLGFGLSTGFPVPMGYARQGAARWPRGSLAEPSRAQPRARPQVKTRSYTVIPTQSAPLEGLEKGFRVFQIAAPVAGSRWGLRLSFGRAQTG